MFFWRLKRGIAIVCALLLAIGAVAVLRLINVSKLNGYTGARTYYLDSASSQSLQTDTLKGLQFLRVKGESVALQESLDGAGIQDILRRYNALVLWTEEVDGVLSYYCYTPCFQESVQINNRKVNLHIATKEERTIIGSPIIFGGF